MTRPLVLLPALLDQARAFFETRGSLGCEGTAMIARSDTTGTCRLVIPDQHAGVAPTCWVEVTAKGKLELAVALANDERYVSRIHSHPVEAFHSPADNANPAITFNGALSIVVPFFGLGLRHGLDACAVYRFANGRWRDLPSGPRRAVAVTVQ